MRLIALLILSTLVVSCSQTRPEPKASARFEVITREQQTLESVQSAPTEFRVSAEQESVAWQRAKLFFTQYLGEPTPVTKRLSPTGTVLTSGSRSTPYFYKVEKYPVSGGQFNYLVSCLAGGSGDRKLATLNAQNLARFISEGQLEVSLLAK